RDHHAVRLRAGALAFAPNKPGIIDRNNRPAAWIEKLAGSTKRALIGRNLLDLCQRETHCKLAVQSDRRSQRQITCPCTPRERRNMRTGGASSPPAPQPHIERAAAAMGDVRLLD